MKSSSGAILCFAFILSQLVSDGAPSSTRSRLGLTAEPSTTEIAQAQLFDRPLIPNRELTPAENRALIAAMERFAERTVRDDFSSLTEFLDVNPDSPWALALQTQLGDEFYRVGRYSKAVEIWARAWEGRDREGDERQMASANRAGSELAMMYARLGRMAELRPLVGQLEKRPSRGQVPRNVRGALDGLWSMEHRPGVSFRCGPLALDRICFATDRARAGNQLIQDSQSTTNGFSAKELATLSRRLGMNYQVAFRAPGAEVILPAVVHWKVGHYAALIARDGELLRAEDPTFGTGKMWLSEDALNDEASGYFLVRSGALPPGWRTVGEVEAHQVWGKGTTLKSYEDATTPHDEKACRGRGGRGMATWDVHLLLASHYVEDTPVGYEPPVGPPIYITASYNAVNGWPDFGLPYSNISQEWRLNWVAYLTDDPMNPFGDIKFAADGGGTMTFTDFNPTNQIFANLFYNRAKLVRMSTNRYELHYPDGWKKIFDQPAAGVGTTRRIFMSAIVDPAGNAATIQFDRPGRIASITDAIGQKTQFFYERPLTNEFIHPSVAWVPPFILTRVMDPFGRTASFDYGSSINARLASITDSIGMTSSFRYDYNPGQVDLGMTNLITPYGTTTFQRSKYNGLYRANGVEITHPNGEKERVEYSEKTPSNVFSTEPLGIVPKGVPVRNYILWARNTYHWDRKAYAEGYALNDYSKARIYHWTHGQDYNTASPILESLKAPLEHRIWLNYDGQVNPTFVGNSDRPTTISRTTVDGTTQIHRLEYNAIGNATKLVDPMGRTLTLNYGANQVDLTEVRQTRAGNNELLLRAAYNSQHLPLTVVDAAGHTNTFTYNARGQALTETNPRGETTTYNYDTNGYLLGIDGPLPGTADTNGFTYDGVGRLLTATDDDGYTLTFAYDGLDRLTRMTYPDATYEEFSYNRLDLEVLRDRAGRETRLTYDSVRQLVAVQDPLGRITRYDWCGCGSLDAIIDPLGRATRWLRDMQGRPSAKVYADGSTVRYEYDKATGWLKSIRDAQNQVTLFDYNLDGTLKQKRYFNTIIPTVAVKFTYDPDYRRMATMEDETGLTRFTYHPVTGGASPGAMQLASIDGPLANDSITFEYDELGREAVRSIDGVGSRRRWDAAGRLMEWTNVLGAFSYAWEGVSFRLSQMTFPNGQRSTFNYFPNQKDRLLAQITHLRPASTLLSRFSYDYDAARQVTQLTEERTGGSKTQWAFAYDAADQLTNAVAMQGAATAETYQYVYDLAGNRVEEASLTTRKKAYYNALNQLVTLTNAPPLATTYEWDAEGRLVAFSQGTHRTEMTYDGFNRRSRVVEREGGVTVSDRRYVWCGLELCEERDAAGAVLKRFSSYGVRAEAGADMPAGTYLVTGDHLESVRELTDGSGAVRAAYNYTPFGERRRVAGDLESDFGFTGHYVHRPSGLHLAVYRAYDANSSRWLSRDPLGESAGLNLYGYVLNDPINLIDPEGLMADDWRMPRWMEDLNVQPAADFAAGFGDTLTTIPFTDISLTAEIRYLTGSDQFVNKCSSEYFGGMVAGTIAQFVLGPKGGLKAKEFVDNMSRFDKARKMGEIYKAQAYARKVDKMAAAMRAQRVRVVQQPAQQTLSTASKYVKTRWGNMATGARR